MKNSLPVWRLRAKADKRFRSGHPWVYSNELQESPKGIDPGQAVELQDAAGAFLARGYGNPASLIAFRALSRDPVQVEPHSPAAILEVLKSAGKLRQSLGLGDFSHRLCFGESDGLPGLVIDRFVLNIEPAAQVFSVQIHTAGMNRLQAEFSEILHQYVQSVGDIAWNRTAVIFRNDLAVRKLEGIAEEEARVDRAIDGVKLENADIRVREAGGTGKGTLVFSVDLIEGQKTGFFLDQAANVQLAVQRLQHLQPGTTQATSKSPRAIRILDLCCYVGQWSAQLARVFRAQGLEVEIVAFDASVKALELAKKNIEAQGARCEIVRGDVLKDLTMIPDRSFDIVISDPPGLIKGRKDIPAGTHAYLQLNTQVFRLVRPGGAVVTCSCSSLLEEDEFTRVLSKAAYRNKARVRWVARGSQAPDHPMLLEFPEGHYLKCWIGLTSSI
jgi:23S rRNA (cytosine1962-C5)-methyltransferase